MHCKTNEDHYTFYRMTISIESEKIISQGRKNLEFFSQFFLIF